MSILLRAHNQKKSKPKPKKKRASGNSSGHSNAAGQATVWHWELDEMPTTVLYSRNNNEVWCNGEVVETAAGFDPEDGTAVIDFYICLDDQSSPHLAQIRKIPSNSSRSGAAHLLFVDGTQILEHAPTDSSSVPETQYYPDASNYPDTEYYTANTANIQDPEYYPNPENIPDSEYYPNAENVPDSEYYPNAEYYANTANIPEAQNASGCEYMVDAAHIQDTSTEVSYNAGSMYDDTSAIYDGLGIPNEEDNIADVPPPAQY